MVYFCFWFDELLSYYFASFVLLIIVCFFWCAGWCLSYFGFYFRFELVLTYWIVICSLCWIGC